MEGDAAGVKRTRNILIFQSTPSVWRETVIWEMQRKRRKYFNPLPPCGGRHVIAPNSHLVQYFNPLPPCGGRRQCAAAALHTDTISIHSLRVEGDGSNTASTPALRNFNPLPPCGGRPCHAQTRPHVSRISIHSLRVEGDDAARVLSLTSKPFQSTPSVWRETLQSFCDSPQGWISIHSLRVEGDSILRSAQPAGSNFNPLPPCGGRQIIEPELFDRVQFQSTPSVWRETIDYARCSNLSSISIHSLRVEGDLRSHATRMRHTISIHSLRVEGDNAWLRLSDTMRYFNPLPPCGGRRWWSHWCRHTQKFQSTPSVWRETTGRIEDRKRDKFQSTPSVWRETWSLVLIVVFYRISIHSLRVEGDQGVIPRRLPVPYFNPLPPCGGRQHHASPRPWSVNFNPLPPCGGRPQS